MCNQKKIFSQSAFYKNKIRQYAKLQLPWTKASKDQSRYLNKMCTLYMFPHFLD
jgi:hypothetical protein